MPKQVAPGSQPTPDADRDAKHAAFVKELIAKAQSYARTDPRVALAQARVAAEAMCRHVFEREVGEPGKVMLDELVRLLSQKKVIPVAIEIPFRTVQAYGNFGAHVVDIGPITPGYVAPCFAALVEAAEWYFRDYLGLASAQPAPVSSEHARSGPCTVVLTGVVAGERRSLRKDRPFRIGRAPEADLCLPEDDRKVSRDHAVIEPSGDAYVLRDLGSKNGSWINGARIAGPVVLQHGDELRVGRTVVLIDLGASASRPRIAAPTETEHEDDP
jgi:hypothetical protein